MGKGHLVTIALVTLVVMFLVYRVTFLKTLVVGA